MNKKIATGRGKDRPKGTRCYVPGYNDDQAQFKIDQQQLGIAPLAIAAVAKPVLGISFKTPSEKRAAKVIGGVIASANSGNLSAAAILDTRRYIGIAKERAVWSGGFNQVSPSVRTVYDPISSQIKSTIPASAQATPEAAASWALSHPQGPPAKVTEAPKPGVPGPQQPSMLPEPAQPAMPGYQPPNISITMPSLPSGGGVVAQPSNQLPGGEVPPTDALAKPPAQASLADMFGGGGMAPIFLAGAGLFILSQVMGKKRR